MSVRDDIAAGLYETKLPYPAKPKNPSILSAKAGALSDEELASVPKTKGDHEKAMADYREARAAYDKDEARLLAQFQADLEAEFGVVGHPKADKLYALAWERGHASGLAEVVTHYEELVDLVV